MAIIEIMKISEDCYENECFQIKKYDMQTCLWKHLDYDACSSSSTVIKKEASKKPEVELNSDVLPVNWILFYHTAYDIKQIT